MTKSRFTKSGLAVIASIPFVSILAWRLGETTEAYVLGLFLPSAAHAVSMNLLWAGLICAIVGLCLGWWAILSALPTWKHRVVLVLAGLLTSMGTTWVMNGLSSL